MHVSGKNYVFKRKPGGSLVSHFSKLRDTVEGTAVDTHRKVEIEKAHLPTSLWKMA